MEKLGMSTYQLADACGYTQSDVARSLSPDYANWKLERVYRYAKALGVAPRELMPGKSAKAKGE
jgi:transcriptional regulator with XRE-family HTH domain